MDHLDLEQVVSPLYVRVASTSSIAGYRKGFTHM
jgi:hypothetical protein